MLKKTIAALLVVPTLLTFTPHLNTTTNYITPRIIKNEKELICLADNIYHEAKNQSRAGKMAVAFVTLNRTHHRSYPENVCNVVYQRYNNVCQFSWVCMNRTINNVIAYTESKSIAKMVMLRYNTLLDPTEGALFFHAHYVNPPWAKTFKKTVRIDDHIFYTLKRQ